MDEVLSETYIHKGCARLYRSPEQERVEKQQQDFITRIKKLLIHLVDFEMLRASQLPEITKKLKMSGSWFNNEN